MKTAQNDGGRPAFVRAVSSGPAVTGLTLVASFELTKLVFGSASFALALCAAILVHELGHFAVAKLGGFAITWPIIALPLGGVVLMDPESAPDSDCAEATAVAAGPLLGLLAAGAVAATSPTPGSLPATFVSLSVLVNALNLLPVGALDGGRLAGYVGTPAWLDWPLTACSFAISSVLGLTLVIAVGLAHFAGPRSRSRSGRARRIAAFGWLSSALLVAVLTI